MTAKDGLLEPAIALEPQLMRHLLPKMTENFKNLLEAVPVVRVYQNNKQTIEMCVLMAGSNQHTQKELYAQVLADLCYRYNKVSKELFLSNPFLSFVFVCFAILKLQALSIDLADDEAEDG